MRRVILQLKGVVLVLFLWHTIVPTGIMQFPPDTYSTDEELVCTRVCMYVSMYVLCTPLYECVMKKEVQGRWGRVATRCAAIAEHVEVSRREEDIIMHKVEQQV